MRRQISAFIKTTSPENSDNLYVASSVGAGGEREDRGGFVAAIWNIKDVSSWELAMFKITNHNILFVAIPSLWPSHALSYMIIPRYVYTYIITLKYGMFWANTNTAGFCL